MLIFFAEFVDGLAVTLDCAGHVPCLEVPVPDLLQHVHGRKGLRVVGRHRDRRVCFARGPITDPT